MEFLNAIKMVKKINIKRVGDSVSNTAVRKRIQDALMKFKSNDLKRMQSFARVTDSQGRIREDVVFLMEDDDTVLAVFPKTYGIADYDKDTMVCYAHAGQHSVCTYDYADSLKPAKKADYEPLQSELEKVGYVLEVLDKLPEEADLQREYHVLSDSYRNYKRGLSKVQDNVEQIEDARLLERGEEIERNGKRGKVQYALFHGTGKPVIIRWQNEDGSEEFEIPYDQVPELKVKDDADVDTAVEENAVEAEAPETEVADKCGSKKKVKIFKRNKKG